MTELYYLNYLYRFTSGGLVYYLLHLVFPSRQLDDFINQPETAAEVRRYYNERWDVSTAETGQILGLDNQNSRDLDIESNEVLNTGKQLV